MATTARPGSPPAMVTGAAASATTASTSTPTAGLTAAPAGVRSGHHDLVRPGQAQPEPIAPHDQVSRPAPPGEQVVEELPPLRLLPAGDGQVRAFEALGGGGDRVIGGPQHGQASRARPRPGTCRPGSSRHSRQVADKNRSTSPRSADAATARPAPPTCRTRPARPRSGGGRWPRPPPRREGSPRAARPARRPPRGSRRSRSPPGRGRLAAGSRRTPSLPGPAMPGHATPSMGRAIDCRDPAILDASS